MQRKKQNKSLQRFLILASGLAFLSSTAVFVIQGMFGSSQHSPTTNRSTTLSLEEQFIQQIEGYELVLQREPNNPVALEGLLTLRLQLRDARGALEPLEKLIELYPDRERYRQTLNIVKQQIALEKQAESAEKKQNNLSQ